MNTRAENDLLCRQIHLRIFENQPQVGLAVPSGKNAGRELGSKVYMLLKSQGCSAKKNERKCRDCTPSFYQQTRWLNANKNQNEGTACSAEHFETTTPTPQEDTHLHLPQRSNTDLVVSKSHRMLSVNWKRKMVNCLGGRGNLPA